MMPPPNFVPPNFSMPPPGFANGMPPGMMANMSLPPPMQQNVPVPLDPATQDIWVETKTPEGKVRKFSVTPKIKH